MINLNQLKGTTLRKIFGATRTAFGYHNKHKDGSGNFGINIIFEREGMIDAGCGIKTQDRSIYDITGAYQPDGSLYSLSFGVLYQAGSRGLEDMTFEEFVEFAKKYIETWNKNNSMRTSL
jgi:hypothetical protein